MERYNQRCADCRRGRMSGQPFQGNGGCGMPGNCPGQTCGGSERNSGSSGCQTGRSDPCGCSGRNGRSGMTGRPGQMRRGGMMGRYGSCGCENASDRDGRSNAPGSCGCQTGRSGTAQDGRSGMTGRCGCEGSLRSGQSPDQFNVCRSGAQISQENAKVGMGYVPWQRWECTYPLDRALFIGTVFPSLDKPFVIGRCAVRP